MRLITHNYTQDPQTIITASSQNNNFPASNIAQEHRAKQWRSTGNSEEWIKFDLRTTEEINSVVLLWPKGDFKLSNDAVIKIQASATTDFSTTGVDQILTFSNGYEIASHYFTTDQSFRYWRVLIQDPSNVYGYVNLGVVVLGKSESLDQPENGFNFNKTDTSSLSSTEYGQTFVDEKPILSTLELNFSVMDYPIAKAFIDSYELIGIRKPVFVVLDEQSQVFDKDLFSIYGRFDRSMNITHITYDLFESSLTITESN